LPYPAASVRADSIAIRRRFGSARYVCSTSASSSDSSGMGQKPGGFFVSGAGYPIYRSRTPHCTVEIKLDESGGAVEVRSGAAEIGQGVVAAVEVDENRVPVTGGVIERINYDGDIDGAVEAARVIGRGERRARGFERRRPRPVPFPLGGRHGFRRRHRRTGRPGRSPLEERPRRRVHRARVGSVPVVQLGHVAGVHALKLTPT